jgi:CRISPR-associated protein (TIGR02584 family)
MNNNGLVPPEKRTILVCGLGTSPQVVTETVQCLNSAYRTYPPVAEVYVLTTTTGQTRVPGLRQELARYAEEFRGEPITFPDENVLVPEREGVSLEDLRSIEDTKAFAETAFALLKRLSIDPVHDENTLAVSVAGGRKAMSSIMTAVFSLVARPQDVLVHVLVEPSELEGDPGFYYIPRRGTVRLRSGGEIPCERARLRLMEIPAPRLRLFLGGRERVQSWAGYQDATSEAQALLDAPPGQSLLFLHARFNHLRVGEGREVTLPPQAMALYTYFARLKKEACVRPERPLCGSCRDCWVPLAILEEGVRARARGRPLPSELPLPPPTSFGGTGWKSSELSSAKYSKSSPYPVWWGGAAWG